MRKFGPAKIGNKKVISVFELLITRLLLLITRLLLLITRLLLLIARLLSITRLLLLITRLLFLITRLLLHLADAYEDFHPLVQRSYANINQLPHREGKNVKETDEYFTKTCFINKQIELQYFAPALRLESIYPFQSYFT